MYPATIFNWHDESEIVTSNSSASTVDDAPLFMQVFSADKGTEDLVEIYGDAFTAMYGTMDFSKHGQSAIQAKNIIDAGGRLLAKRVVAEDSELANVILCAKVSTTNGCEVKWTSSSVTGCKTFAEVKAKALAMLDDTNGVYPLIVYAENGRGVSGKAVRLTPDYATSKTIGKTFYTLSVYEGTTSIEKETISIDPTVVYNNNSYRLDQLSCVQIDGEVIESVFDLYATRLANDLTLDVDTVRSYDIIYGYTNRGSAIPGFTLNAESVDLDSEVGIKLASGSNGAFGTAPANTAAWSTAIADVFIGNFSDEVWDVDQHKIAAVVDANYPMEVKKAIFAFVTFRKDCVYLRDYGLGLTTFLEIKAKHDEFNEDVTINEVSYPNQKNYFVADYYTTYQIKDPVSKKNIEVTMLYDLAAALVNHIANNPYAPIAGYVNGFTLPSAIKGTVNFIPVNTPKINQKEAIDELRVNYAVFNDDNCVVQSCYTSQDAYTQLSYLSNVVAIQRVLRAVRTACPRQRYSLATASDLSNYATAVNNVLSNYVTNFSVLDFEYVEDSLKASQKIFYASIRFAFLNWAQTEIFDIYAINND